MSDYNKVLENVKWLLSKYKDVIKNEKQFIVLEIHRQNKYHKRFDTNTRIFE